MISSKTLSFWICVSIFIVIIKAECPRIVSKKQWRGRLNREIDYLIIPVKYAIIQHTVSEECNDVEECSQIIKNMQDYYMDTLEYHDIGYNFLIGNDGNIYEGVGWHKQGAHTYGWNRKALGIAFLGDFSNKLPPQAAINAAKKLLECGVQKGELDSDYTLYGHRQLITTQSPGTKLYQEIKKWPHYSEIVDY